MYFSQLYLKKFVSKKNPSANIFDPFSISFIRAGRIKNAPDVFSPPSKRFVDVVVVVSCSSTLVVAGNDDDDDDDDDKE